MGIRWTQDARPSHNALPIDVKPTTTTILMPTFVDPNHWILCVANMPEANSREGTVDYYDSFRESGDEAVAGALSILEEGGRDISSPLAGISWRVNRCICGRQTNSDDCGIFVHANASAIVFGTPLPESVTGWRIQIAAQIIKAAKREPLDWATIKDMLTPATGVQSVLGVAEGDDVDMEEPANDDNDNDVAEEDEAEDDGMELTDYRCNICWYFYASSDETLKIHKSVKHNTDPFLCEWPGCRTVMPDKVSLEAHIEQVHERKTYYCTIRVCHKRFLIEAIAQQHVLDEHDDLDPKLHRPEFLHDRYRHYDLTEMRGMRERAERMWKSKYNSVDMQHDKIAELYAAYKSETARNYFSQRGLLGQNFGEERGNCRTLQRIFAAAQPGVIRPSTKNYKLRIRYGENSPRIVQTYAWWILLLNQEEGSQLDKYISNLVLGGSWTETSHKCHWAFCFVLSHLEQVPTIENLDRNVCKNRSRGRDGGCNALQSLHPHHHCLLDNATGTEFDANLEGPLKAVRGIGRPKRHRGPSGPVKKADRKGPCSSRGCEVTNAKGWALHPDDNTQVVCDSCYQRIRRARIAEKASI